MPALARHRVIRIDLPGSGRSQRAEGPLSIERYVETLLSVCARLGRDARALARPLDGHHRLPARRGRRSRKLVRSLALFGPLIAPPDAARAAIRARAAKARGEGAAGMHEIALGAAQGGDLGRHAPALAARRRLRAREPDAPGRRGLRAQLRGAGRGAAAAAVEQIEAPVLLVTGDEDGVAPPQPVRAMAERLHARAQQARRRAAALRPLDADRAARGMRARAARLPRRATLTNRKETTWPTCCSPTSASSTAAATRPSPARCWSRATASRASSRSGYGARAAPVRRRAGRSTAPAPS